MDALKASKQNISVRKKAIDCTSKLKAEHRYHNYIGNQYKEKNPCDQINYTYEAASTHNASPTGTANFCSNSKVDNDKSYYNHLHEKRVQKLDDD